MVVVAGVAQALALLAHVLREEGVHRIAVEDPGSLGARQQLEYGRLEPVPVRVDEAGLDVAALRASGAGAVLLTPAHQFPTGVVLDGERRRDLLGWAAAGGLVIEDDYDAEHRYDRAPVPALRALLPEAVCYAGSVSKLLAPALRLGWLLVPPRLRDAVTAAKRYADLGNPVLAQLVLARLMDSGELERHLRHVRRRHRRRRDAMLRAVAELLPGARVHGAAAGLHLMVTFDGAGFEDTALASAALALGVKTHPLSWHRVRPGPPGLVLGYAAGSAGEIEEGIATLATALASVVGGLPETGRKVFPERRQPPGGRASCGGEGRSPASSTRPWRTTVKNLKRVPLAFRRTAFTAAAAAVAVALAGPAFAASGSSATPSPSVSVPAGASPTAGGPKPSPSVSTPPSASPSAAPSASPSAAPGVVAPAPGSSTRPSASPSEPAAAPGAAELAHTGSSATTIAMGAGATGLVLAGAGALYAVRRRANS